MATEPQPLIEHLEATASLPKGSEERVNGYNIVGLPFKSGHILAMSRSSASSVGPGFTSVWHRSPNGNWVFYTDVSPRQACPRYFGAVALYAIETEIITRWLAPFRLHVVMPAVPFEWEITAGTTAATWLMNTVGRLLPNAAWRSSAVLTMIGIAAGPLLGVGRIRLHGRVPNGQHFLANPRVVWTIVDSHARLAGEDFGSPGAVRPQAHLGDFWIPQRGILAIRQAYFDPFDPKCHSSRTSRMSNE